ncbi:hypothetical protein [Streptomyces sp. NRRL S-146]|uniref:hypothetical protein n=1 Tax=Streptomyces sp. NRRL S-146 TaxID=1463884 RepID=UPI00068948AE|nr:hypothetical protein [Streptomyces sp. NRRL S-146]
MYDQDVRTRLENAIKAMVRHPDARRRPLPSVKAGRLAMRELGMTRAARRQESSSGAYSAFIFIGDAVADAYHLASEHGLSPEGLDALHEIRLTADQPFPADATSDVIDLAHFFGNVQHLGAVAYDLCPEALIQHGLLHYNAERLGL